MSSTEINQPSFKDLNLSDPLLKALDQVGYENPSPIQAKIIPFILKGRDVVGQAQTGTGKTAAFALPLLCRLNLQNLAPQVLVLAPTRELVIQVAEAFHEYATYMKGFHVMPIYGGQEYNTQIKQLKRGVHVVVGTPGRVMDHMRRGTLNLDSLQCLVLDEADEMLRMGFIDDVEWVLEQTPPDHQVALFSATMPEAIRRIAQRHLKNPEQVTIKVKTTTADTIHQRYWMVSGFHKLDALTRILEAETFDAILIFVRTKTATVELAEKLAARGYAAAALNGDIPQKLRIRTVERLKSGDLDIVVATDVAARGLDVERISHVINYDIPCDTESYVHRIGRTGRAGRKGEAILFVAPRERIMLAAIEKATRQKIAPMELPSTELINDKRIAQFFKRISDTLDTTDVSFYLQLLDKYHKERGMPHLEIAAVLAHLYQGPNPLLLSPKPETKRERGSTHGFKDSVQKPETKRGRTSSHGFKDSVHKPETKRERAPTHGFKDSVHDKTSRRQTSTSPKNHVECYRIEVGQEHGVKPSNIVGAIANEGDLNSKHIGHIEIFDTYSLVELPRGLEKIVLEQLKKAWVAGRQLKISKAKPAKELK